MITLKEQLRRQAEAARNTATRLSIRDRLLSRELNELLPPKNCSIIHEDVNDLSTFKMIIKPNEGYWKGGCFKFTVRVPEEYNMVPPIVKCLTRLWHPNISETGEICLSLLRSLNVDGLGWTPTRRLNDVVWGVASLFTDLLNFEDPLNVEAAEMHRCSITEFQKKVSEYVTKYAKD